MTFMNEKERNELRSNIERETQEYLKKGGRILEVPAGMTGIGGNGLLSFRINNTESPQPRNNNGLFAESTKVKKAKKVKKSVDK